MATKALSFLPANFRIKFTYIIGNNVSPPVACICSPDRDTLARTRRQLKQLFPVIRRGILLLYRRTQSCVNVDLVDDIAAGNLLNDQIFTTPFSFPTPNNLDRFFSRDRFLPYVYFCLCITPFFPFEEFIIRHLTPVPDITISCISLFRQRLPRINDRARHEDRSVPDEYDEG